MAESHPAIEFRSVGKTFPGVTALGNVSLAIGGTGGVVHAVIGENGAGKSTLMKLLSGLCQPTAGEILLFGKPVLLRSPQEAQAAGVVMVHQELNLIDELPVADNIFLGRERTRVGFINRGEQAAESRRLLASLRCDRISPEARCGDLSIAERQMVEIAKALSCGARILIMDEPTAVLTRRETEALFDVINGLKSEGVTILYVSHLLEEVVQIADRVTVLRDGRVVTTLNEAETKSATPRQLASLMVGRPMEQQFPVRRARTGGDDVVLDVRNLTLAAPERVKDVSFQIRRGEIFGLAGLIGAGRTEVAEAIAGLRKRSAGRIFLDGRELDIRAPRDAVRAGIAYLSEDRKATGLTLGLSVLENMTLASLGQHTRFGFLDSASERRTTQKHVDAMRIKTPGVDQPIEMLSGGNQQKVALAKWLETQPKLLIVDEPTRGVDIGAKEQIYHLIHSLTASGMTCLVISSELNEVLGLCDRVGVMRNGRLEAILDGSTATEQSVMQVAAGNTATDNAA